MYFSDRPGFPNRELVHLAPRLLPGERTSISRYAPRETVTLRVTAQEQWRLSDRPQQVSTRAGFLPEFSRVHSCRLAARIK